MMRWLLILSVLAGPAAGQKFTTAAEVRPILQATTANWLALKEIDGTDYLYFTHLESWRCGLSAVAYAVNDGPLQTWEMEQCYEDTAAPNAMVEEGRVPLVTFPGGSVQKVVVSVALDDGEIMGQAFERKDIVLP